MRITKNNNHQRQEVKTPKTHPYMAEVLAKYRKVLWPIFGFSFFINLSMLAMPIYLLQIYDRVLPNKSIETLVALFVIVILMIVVVGFLEVIRNRIVVKLGVWFENCFSGHLLSGALSRTVDYDEDNAAGTLRDLEQLKNALAGNHLVSLMDVVWAPIFILALFWLHPTLGGIVCGGLLVMAIIAAFNHRGTRASITASYDSRRASNETVDSYLNSADSIRAMGMQHSVINRWQLTSKGWREQAARQGQAQGKLQAQIKTLRMALQVIVLSAAAWLILQGQLTAGATMASLLLMQRAIGPFENIMTSWKTLMSARFSYLRINHRLRFADTLKGEDEMPVVKAPLVVEKLRFRCSGQKQPLIAEASFELKQGESMAILGESSVGKTTLIKLMLGLQKPADGIITFDGYDAQQWSASTLGRHVGYLSQDVELCHATVRDNISRMGGESSLLSAIEAAKLAGVHEMIQALPQGYDTLIGPQGVYLSAGESHRIGLARAVYGSPALVVLDEPETRLDKKGQLALLLMLDRLRRQGTMVIVVTRHPVILKSMNHVYQLKQRRLSLLQPIKKQRQKQSQQYPTNVRRIRHG